MSAYLDKIESKNVLNYDLRKRVLKEMGFKPNATIYFKIFIQYVIKTVEEFIHCKSKITCNKKLNEHWKPYFLRCPYCDVKYNNFIGRLETFDRDTRYICMCLAKGYFKKVNRVNFREMAFRFLEMAKIIQEALMRQIKGESAVTTALSNFDADASRHMF